MNFKEPVKLDFNNDVAYFIGVLQGDGHINKGFDKNGWLSRLALVISVGHNDKPYALFIKKLIKNKLNYSAVVWNEKSCYRVAIYDRGLVRAFEEFKLNMQIPDFVLKNNKLLAAYLQGLFDTDGCCYIRNNTGVIDFSNTREELVESIRSVLELKFNIKSYIRSYKKKDYKPMYRLMVTNKSNILPFINKIGFRHPRKKKLGENLLKIYVNVRQRAVRNTGHEKIVRVLQENREITTNDIANKLSLHRETVKEHLEKLEKKKLVEKRIVYFNRWGVIENPSCKRYYWRLRNGA